MNKQNEKEKEKEKEKDFEGKLKIYNKFIKNL